MEKWKERKERRLGRINGRKWRNGKDEIKRKKGNGITRRKYYAKEKSPSNVWLRTKIMEERGGGEVKWSEEMDKHGETTSRLSKRIRRTDGAHYITRWPMDRDGRWNRGRGHARVSGDCSHWLENQGETGRNVTGIRWAGREQGLTDVHQRFSIHNYAYHPVHNNFDSRVIIAFFGAKQVFPKNTLSWDDDFQPFFRIDWRESHLFLFVLLFFAPIFSISFNCEILSFFLSSSPRFHHFISSFSGFNAWLHFSSFLPFSHDLFHSQSSFSLSPFPPQFPFSPSSSIEAFYPAKSGQRILPTYSFRPRLFTFHPFYPFISLFPHVRKNKK